MSRPKTALTPQGVKIELGEEIARGGEGAVYHIRGLNDVVAKIYHASPDSQKAVKLAAMVSMASTDLLAVSAWPRELLHVGAGGELRGVIMPRVQDHRAIHILYGPAQRRKEFPRADWRFLVHTAQNVAAAFATVHQHGHVLGDVNQGNLLVSHDARVKLIDCDSMQIRAGGRVHLCEVGVAHFTPPELQNRSFAGIVRDANHDAFGLAVLVFHLLFMGRHPFAGIYGGPGEMPIEKAIAEGRFAYGRDAAHARMRPPPHTLSLAHLSPQVADLFERAFAAGTPRRPEAREWYAALQQLGAALQPCGRHPGHRYHPSSAGCPWCAIEQAGGPDFFVSLVVASMAGSGFDLEALWREVQILPSAPAELAPQLIAPPAAANPSPVPPRVRWGYGAGIGSLWLGGLVLGLAALAGDGATGLVGSGILLTGLLLIFASGARAEKVRRRRRLEETRLQHQKALARYTAEVRGPADELRRVRKAFDRCRDAHQDLPSRYRTARAALTAQVRQNQLQRFLDRYYLADARIPGVGSGRIDALASFGIETAADVTSAEVMQVPGFGPKLTSKVLAWRAGIESRFVFDPNAGVDPADATALDRKFAQEKRELEKEAADLALRLKRASALAARAYGEVYPVLEGAARALSQAQADTKVF